MSQLVLSFVCGLDLHEVANVLGAEAEIRDKNGGPDRNYSVVSEKLEVVAENMTRFV